MFGYEEVKYIKKDKPEENIRKLKVFEENNERTLNDASKEASDWIVKNLDKIKNPSSSYGVSWDQINRRYVRCVNVAYDEK